MDKRARVKAVLLDFDGTLVTLAVNWEHLRARLRERLAPLGFDSTFRPLTEALREARAFAERTQMDNLWQDIMAILREEEGRGLAGARLMPGAKEFLGELAARQIPFAIVSNNDSVVIKAAFAQFDLPTAVIVVGRDMVRDMKPHPEGALLALTKIGARADECWLIGDSRYDALLGDALAVARTILVGPENIDTPRVDRVRSLVDVRMNSIPAHS